MDNKEKKYTLITGATGGLGQAFANYCGEKNYNLILTATSDDKLTKLKNSLSVKYPTINILTKQCNLLDDKSIVEFFDWSKKITIERLILNAGLIIQDEFLSHSSLDNKNAIKINCESNIEFAQHFLETRQKNANFYLINVSSFAAFNPMPYMSIYGATKAFLLNFFVALRNELKTQKVYISCVCPSGMATTEAMKKAIEVQGFGGKITENNVNDIAKISIEKNLKNKPIIVVGFVNKLLRFCQSKLTKPTVSNMIYKRWKKSNNKLKKV